MKKRVLSLLLVVALLASLVVFPAYATDSDVCPCGCGDKLDEIEWKPWVAGVAPVEGGHYRLYEDLTTGTMVFGTSKNDNSFVLDLYGNVWRATTGNRLMTLGSADGATAEATILDTVGGGEMQATGVAGGSAGVVQVDKDTTLNIKGGTLRQLYDANINLSHSGVMLVQGNAVVNMSGGKITDGYIVLNTSTNGTGGNVRVTGNGVFNMSGGEITNGHALKGGGVYIAANSATMNMTGGKIYNNVAYQEGEALTDSVGGNICCWDGDLNITGTKAEVYGGVASYGGNIYNGASGITVLSGIENVKGDIYTASSALTLAGKVTIPTGNSTGVGIASGKTITIDSTFSADSRVYMNIAVAKKGNADNAFTAALDNAADIAGCFVGVGATDAITVKEGMLSAHTNNGTASANLLGYCPHCNQQVVWIRTSAYYSGTTVKTLEAGHYFGYGTPTSTAGWQVAADAEVVFDMGGLEHGTKSGAQFFNVTGANSSLTILDTIGGGTITANGKADHGGVIRNTNDNGASLRIMSGVIQLGTSPNAGIKRGGVIMWRGGNMTIDGGIIRNGVAYSTYNENGTVSASNPGGNIWFGSAATDEPYTFTMTSGLISGGKAVGEAGGNIYIQNTVNCNITGGMIENGQSTTLEGGVGEDAARGGNILIYGSANTTANVSNAVLRGGNAVNNGGNIAVYGSASCTLDNLTLAGGFGKNGGNLYTNGSISTVSDSVIYNGKATADGGNIYMGASDETSTLEDCMIYNGEAHANDTEEEAAVAVYRSHNANAGQPIVLDGVRIYNDTKYEILGTGVVAAKSVTLKGDTRIGNDKHVFTNSIYLYGDNSSLHVDESFSGVALISGNFVLPQGYRSEPYGQTLLRSDAGDFTGKLYLGDHLTTAKYEEDVLVTPSEHWEIGTPQIFHADGKLVVEEGVVVKADEAKTFYNNAASAIEAYQAGNVLKLYMAEADLALADGVEYIIDLNGSNATVTGEATVYGIDSKTDDHKNAATGSLVAEDATVMAVANDVDGDVYVRTVDAETEKFEFHHIAMDIKSIVLRTSNAGVYYKGAWTCDDELADHLKAQADGVQFGIVAGVVEAPANGFNESEDFRWSYNSGAGFESGVVATGALIKGILKDDNTAEINAENFNTAINAAAYLMVTEDSGDVTYVVGKTGASKSYMDMFVQIDKIVGEDVEANAANIEKMNNFYNDWAAAIEIAKAVEGAHEFVNIFQTPAEA